MRAIRDGRYDGHAVPQRELDEAPVIHELDPVAERPRPLRIPVATREDEHERVVVKAGVLLVRARRQAPYPAHELADPRDPEKESVGEGVSRLVDPAPLRDR